MAAPYSFARDFNADTFTVDPEPLEIGGVGALFMQGIICLVFMSGCTAASVGIGGSGGFLAFLFGLIIFGLAFYIPYQRITRQRAENARDRSQVQIHVGDTDLRVGVAAPDQVVIPYERLHRLVVRNSMDGEFVGASTGGFVVAGGSGVMGAASMATTGLLAGAANMAAKAHARKMNNFAKVCFQVVAEASGEAFPLAHGMTETGANGLMNDLAKAVQERQRT